MPVEPPSKEENHHFKLPWWGWLLTLLLALLIGAYIAIDSGLIKSNINLPFHLFNQKDETSGPATIPSTPVQMSVFQNKDLGLKFEYPTAWGKADLAKGLFPNNTQSGDYRQITFSQNKLIDINLVVTPYSSTLTGCLPTDPVDLAQYELAKTRASTIGWETDKLKVYLDISGKPTIKTVASTAKGSNPGWDKVGEVGNTLIYKNLVTDDTKVKAQAANPADECNAKITEEQATEANGYDDFVHYVTNYANLNVQGINAQYDARTGADQTTVELLITTLNSIEDL